MGTGSCEGDYCSEESMNVADTRISYLDRCIL